MAKLTIGQVSISDADHLFGDGWHNEIDLKAIGTQDVGKTAWEIGDQIIVTMVKTVVKPVWVVSKAVQRFCRLHLQSDTDQIHEDH